MRTKFCQVCSLKRRQIRQGRKVCLLRVVKCAPSLKHISNSALYCADDLQVCFAFASSTLLFRLSYSGRITKARTTHLFSAERGSSLLWKKRDRPEKKQKHSIQAVVPFTRRHSLKDTFHRCYRAQGAVPCVTPTPKAGLQTNEETILHSAA